MSSEKSGVPLTIAIIVVLCIGGCLLFPDTLVSYSTHTANNTSGAATDDGVSSDTVVLVIVGFGVLVVYQIRNYIF
jgi:hypothetical protein